MKNRKNMGILIIAISVIIVLAAVMKITYSSQPKLTENGIITVKSGDKILGTVSIDDIKSMPSVKRRMVISSSSGNTTHDFRGTLLSNILNKVDVNIMNTYKTVITSGADNYMSAIDMEDVAEENNVYVMYADGDEPLLTIKGEHGGMRIVLVDDAYGQRFTNYLVEIILE